MVHIQLFNIKLEAIKEWCSSKVILATLLFSIHINDIPTGIEYTLNKVVDYTKLSSSVHLRIKESLKFENTFKIIKSNYQPSITIMVSSKINRVLKCRVHSPL